MKIQLDEEGVGYATMSPQSAAVAAVTRAALHTADYMETLTSALRK